MTEVETVEIACVTHQGDLYFETVELERMDGHLPHQRPGLDHGRGTPKWRYQEIEAMPDRDRAIHLACPCPRLCFAEGDIGPGVRCGPCERWVDDPEEWLRDNARQNERHRARYGRKA